MCVFKSSHLSTSAHVMKLRREFSTSVLFISEGVMYSLHVHANMLVYMLTLRVVNMLT